MQTQYLVRKYSRENLILPTNPYQLPRKFNQLIQKNLLQQHWIQIVRLLLCMWLSKSGKKWLQTLERRLKSKLSAELRSGLYYLIKPQLRSWRNILITATSFQQRTQQNFQKTPGSISIPSNQKKVSSHLLDSSTAQAQQS